MLETIKIKVAELTAQFLKQEKGAETLEYVAIAAVVIILGIAAYQAAAPGIGGVINTALTAIQNAVTGVG
ncbi:MAG: hypothetical protein L0Y38_12420 [Methylococcaceae bacterium]|nr:hypothetical protein [Methylococcaceae bacterium]